MFSLTRLPFSFICHIILLNAMSRPEERELITRREEMQTEKRSCIVGIEWIQGDSEVQQSISSTTFEEKRAVEFVCVAAI